MVGVDFALMEEYKLNELKRHTGKEMQQTSNTQKLGSKIAGSLLAFAVLLSSTFGVAAVQPEMINAAVCTDCQNPEPELPRLNGGIYGLPNLLATMVPAAVSLDKNGESPVRHLEAKHGVGGVGTVKIAFKKDEKFSPAQASGFLINRCLVLTNKHVVTKEHFQEDGIIFETGLNYEHQSYGRVVASGNYDSYNQKTNSEDWAVIKLEDSLGDRAGFLEPMFMSEEEILNNKNLNVAGIIEPGFKVDFHKPNPALRIHESCLSRGYETAFRPTTGWVETNCASLPGASGSPVFTKDSKGKFRAIGIMKNGENKHLKEWRPSTTNGFVPFIDHGSAPQSLTKEKLQEIINNPANKCS